MEPSEQPPKLDYGHAEHTNVLGPLLLVFGGGVLGAAAIAFAGVIAGFASYSQQATGSDRRFNTMAIVIFGGLVVAAVIGCVWTIRQPRRRWFVIGLLLGVGVTSLVEGICFSSV